MSDTRMIKAKEAFSCMWGGQLLSYRAGQEIDHPALAGYLRDTSPLVLDEEEAPEAATKADGGNKRKPKTDE